MRNPSTIPSENGRARNDILPTARASKIRSEKKRWLMPQFMPEGSLILLEGDKGTGKSHVAAPVVAFMTGGPPLPGKKRREPEFVLYGTIEENIATDTIPRLRAAGADLRFVRFLGHEEDGRCSGPVSITGQWERLERAIEEYGAKLLVLDPLSSFVPITYNLNNEQHARRVMEILAGIAKRTGCTIIVVRHLRKGNSGTALQQGMGSVALGAVVRAILRTDHDPNRPGWRVLSSVVCNQAAGTPSIGFQIVSEGKSSRLEWGKRLDVTAEQLAEGQEDAGRQMMRSTAKQLIRRCLAQGPMKTSDVHALAAKEGISPSTLYRAAVDLDVKSLPIGKGQGSYSMWSLSN
jgi:KaiC/GvpD/RAD55 family RecA-like ATPase